MLLLTRSHLELPAVIHQSAEFAYHVVEPLLSQVCPLDFGGWGRVLGIGEKYATKLLRLQGNPAADSISKRLVFGYPHHGYTIDVEEGKSIGLPIDLMDDALIGSVERIVAVAIREVEDSGKAGGYLGFPKLMSTHDGEEGTNKTIQTSIPGSLNALTPNSRSMIETRLLVSRVVEMAKGLSETDEWRNVEGSAKRYDHVEI